MSEYELGANPPSTGEPPADPRTALAEALELDDLPSVDVEGPDGHPYERIDADALADIAVTRLAEQGVLLVTEAERQRERRLFEAVRQVIREGLDAPGVHDELHAAFYAVRDAALSTAAADLRAALEQGYQSNNSPQWRSGYLYAESIALAAGLPPDVLKVANEQWDRGYAAGLAAQPAAPSVAPDHDCPFVTTDHRHCTLPWLHTEEHDFSEPPALAGLAGPTNDLLMNVNLVDAAIHQSGMVLVDQVSGRPVDDGPKVLLRYLARLAAQEPQPQTIIDNAKPDKLP
jgi:hypothetical protein